MTISGADATFYKRNDVPLVVAYGLGVDSTAALIGLQKRGIRPDAILFADVGDEKKETYAYLPVIQEWLSKVNFPAVVTVKYEVQNFKNWPPYYTLGQNCLTNGTLPSLAFGFKSCSMKWKIAPQNKWCEDWAPAVNAWSNGQKVRKIIGYDASPKDRKRFAHAVGVEDPAYEYWYPLIDWGWDRDACKREISAAGLPVPPKSACVFCPSTKPGELHEHRKDYLRMIVIMEARAAPRLEGHMTQEQLDARHTQELARWEQRCQAADKAGKKQPAKPKHKTAGDSKLMRGLWRSGTKGTRGGQQKPGMMTEYIREHGLLPAEEIDQLAAGVPKEIVQNQQLFENGLEIPDWHDFLEAVTEEDALDEVPDGCNMCQIEESSNPLQQQWADVTIDGEAF